MRRALTERSEAPPAGLRAAAQRRARVASRAPTGANRYGRAPRDTHSGAGIPDRRVRRRPGWKAWKGVLSMEHGHRRVTERANFLTLSLTAPHGAR